MREAGARRVGLGEAEVSQGSLTTAEGRSLPLQRTEVQATVTGPIADVVVRQRFFNDSAKPIEAVYAFPLPEEASVYALRFRIGARVVDGVVKSKQEARRVYERAVSEGRAATLVEEDKPEVFTLSVANIAPLTEIEVELRYQDLLAYDDGLWRLRYPMVAPGRYVPSAQGPRRRDPNRAGDVELRVTFPSETPVSEVHCESHLVLTREVEGDLVVALDANGPMANRDFSLVWRAAESGVRPWLHLARAPEAAGTFLLTLTPSAPEKSTEQAGGAGDLKALRCGNCGGVVSDLGRIREIPGLGPVFPCAYCGAVLSPGTDVVTRVTRLRDVLVLVDRSASMRAAHATVERAVSALLHGLGAGDRVELCAFDHELKFYSGEKPGFTVLSPEYVRDGLGWLQRHSARGGSDLENALGVSAALPATPGRTRVVVLLSDGRVGNEGRLFRRLRSLLGAEAHLFAMGVGDIVDARILRKLARLGGGAFESVSSEMNLDETVKRFARKVRAAGPVLTDLKLWWEGADMGELEPSVMPVLYGGEALRVLGQFKGVGPTTLVLTGLTDGGKAFRQELQVNLPAQTQQAPGLPRAWARRRVARLAESAVEDASGEGQALALRFNLVSRWTSLVAEDQVVSVKPVRGRVGVLRVVGGASHRLEHQPKTLGRGQQADIVFSSIAVSRQHAEVVFEEGAHVIQDMGSTSGFMVNREPVKRRALCDGDEIQIGDVTLVYEHLHESAPGAWFEYNPIVRAEEPERVEALEAAALPATGAGFAADGEMSAGAMLEEEALAMPAPGPAKGRGHFAAAPPFAREVDLSDDDDEMAAPHFTGAGVDRRAAVHTSAAPRAPAPMMMRGSPPDVGAAPVSMAAPLAAPMAPGGAPGGAPEGAFGGAPGGPPLGEKRGGGGVVGWFRSMLGSEDAPPPPPPPSPPVALSEMPRPVPAMPPPVSPPVPKLASFEVEPFSPAGAPSSAGPVPQGQASSSPSDLLRGRGSVGYSASELQWLSTSMRGELDLVFLVDATGSMGAYIAEVKRHLLALLSALQASPLCKSLRVGVVSYRDHPPQEFSYVTRVTALGDDFAVLERAVTALAASGGGDGPEAVTDGLFELVKCDWRPHAAKAVVWFGDAPPHGVEPSGDGFGSEDPSGRHWFTQAESCLEMGIAVYAIGCLPGLRGFKGAEAVFRTVARATGGMYLPLREAQLLVPLMCGAAETTLDGQRIDAHVLRVKSAHESALQGVGRDERAAWLTELLTREGVQARDLMYEESRPAEYSMQFRPLTEDDVLGALDRLQLMGL